MQFSSLSSRIQYLLGSGWLAGLVLVAFWACLVASVREKSLTTDEIVHATAGYTYWKYNDYRLNPENGNLPQRIIGLPLLLGNYAFPATDTEFWRTSDEWTMGDDWFHHKGNSVETMLLWGRAANGLLAVALGALVWYWARRLFGPLGGMLSLLLYVLNPTILANGALMTSDMACSLFFLAAVGALWATMHRITPLRVVGSGLVLGALFVSKMSAFLIAPIWLALLAARLWSGGPLPVAFGKSQILTARPQQALVFGLVLIAQVMLLLLVIWGFYGFRYTAFSQTQAGHDRFGMLWEFVLDKPDYAGLLSQLNLTADQLNKIARILQDHNVTSSRWKSETLEAIAAIRQSVLIPGQVEQFDRLFSAPGPSIATRVLEFFRQHCLLPEAYIYGEAFVLTCAQKRMAFLNGEVSPVGWRIYFPYTFLVKTPLAFFLIMALAVGAAWAKWRRLGKPVLLFRAGYDTIPLFLLLGVYWSAAIASNLNIGHRHIMVTYAPLFILCGVGAYWFEAPRKNMRIVLITALAVLATETIYRFPNYLAYFNGIVTPSHGYRHLVDSSLDWGQDLPAVKRYLEKQPGSEHAYLAYFGTASPEYYGIHAIQVGKKATPPIALREVPAEGKTAFLASQPDYEFIGDGVSGEKPLVLILKKPDALRLGEGLYLVSATILQPIYYDPWGPWTESSEATYRTLCDQVKPLLQDDEEVRLAALKTRLPKEWAILLDQFTKYRFGRLMAYLRTREPDDNLNFSILIYRLNAAELERALHGPPPFPGSLTP